MHKLIEYLTNEMKTLEHKVDREGDLSRSELECGDVQAHFLKSLLIIDSMLNSGSSYEGNGGNGYSGRRDSMGRFADGESYGGSYGRYYDDRSMDGGYSGRRYSRDEGKSYLIKQFEGLMQDASSQEEKEIMHQALNKLKNI